MMKRFPEEVRATFEEGWFVARVTDGKFNTVWMDYTTETTANKSLKGSGGIMGLTLKGTALA